MQPYFGTKKRRKNLLNQNKKLNIEDKWWMRVFDNRVKSAKL